MDQLPIQDANSEHSAENSEDLLDLEEGHRLTPIMERRPRLLFATPRPPDSRPEIEEELNIHFNFKGNNSESDHLSSLSSQPSVGGNISVHSTSNMAGSDPLTTQWHRFFVDENPIEDGLFNQNEIVIRKEDWGAPGSTEYRKNYALITDAMEEKFGAAKHFVVSSRDGETDFGNTK